MRCLDLYYLGFSKRYCAIPTVFPVQIVKQFAVRVKGEYLKLETQNWMIQPTFCSCVTLIKSPNLFTLVIILFIYEMMKILTTVLLGSYGYKLR